ncbi:MAG: TadG family pilus assembly protein [Dongiaceae bacterium]
MLRVETLQGFGIEPLWRRAKIVWRRFERDKRAAVLIYVTMGMTVFLGFTALAIDGSYLFLMNNRAQAAADSAALAGASQLPDDATAETEAIAFAEKNLAVADYGTVLAGTDVTAGTWDSATRIFTPGGANPDAVEVIVRMDASNNNPVQLFFASILGSNETGVSARAVATATGGSGGIGPNCMQALNTEDANAFRVVGTANIYGEGCNIQVDSCHETDAFVAEGVPTIDLTVELDGGGTGSGYLNVCGGMNTTPGVDLPDDPYVNEGTGESHGDPFDRPPFDALPDPADFASCDFATRQTRTGGTNTLVAGTYCGGISLGGNGTTTLAAGTYYITGGSFEIKGKHSVIGDGVTIVLSGSTANLDLGGTADLALKAPTTGDYAGFVFFSDRDNPATNPHAIRGTPLGAFSGIAYFPNAAATLRGTADGSLPNTVGDCSVLVADSFFFNGTISLELANACSEYAGLPAFDEGVALTMRLVD